MPHDNYRIGVPQDGHYDVLLNTDSAYYGGSNYDIGTGFTVEHQGCNGLPYSLVMNLPPLAAVYLKRQ